MEVPGQDIPSGPELAAAWGLTQMASPSATVFFLEE